MTRAYIKKCLWDSAPHRNDMDFPQEREQQNVLSRACMHARSPRVFTTYPKLCNPKTLNFKIIIMKKNFVRL